MNIHKTILAAVLGLSIANLSNAGVVYLTGSTAARGAVYTTLAAAGAVFTAAPTVTTYKGSSASGSTYMAFSGTLVGGSGTTVINCDWSGSEAGINDVATGASETFMDPAQLNGQNNGAALPPNTVTHTVDLAMADNNQSFSRTTSPSVGQQTEVGIITFEWVRNNGNWTGTNVTDAQIQQALGGYAARALFTGNTSDTNDFVYVSGRDNLSGTRVNAFGDSGFGILTAPNQVEINSSGVMQNLDGAGTYAGDYGFSSGGTLAGTLGANTSSNNVSAVDQVNGGNGYSVIAYLGYSDAAAAITAGAKLLTYNGVAFSSAAIIEGQYSFWGNEYCDRSTTANSEAQTAYTRLTSKTTGINAYADGVSFISLSAMHCTRFGPNTSPIHN